MGKKEIRLFKKDWADRLARAIFAIRVGRRGDDTLCPACGRTNLRQIHEPRWGRQGRVPTSLEVRCEDCAARFVVEYDTPFRDEPRVTRLARLNPEQD